MKKKLLMASAVAVSTLGVAGSAMAASETANQRQSEMATKFAERFNLNKDEVAGFLEEQRDAKRAEIEAKVSDALKSAGFSDEQITALQEKKKAQREEHQAWREANPDATKEQRREYHENEREEFEEWAKTQGIDLEKVRSSLKDAVGHGMHRGPRGNF